LPGRSEGLAAIAVLLGYGLAVTFLQRPYEDAIFGLGLAVVIAAGASRGLRAGLVMSVAVAAVNVMVVLVGATEELGPALARSALFLAAHALGGVSVGSLGEGLGRERARRQHAERAAEFLATHDPLTALPSRSMLEDRLDVEIAHAGRERETLAVMLVDLDRFKNVNDALGHEAGDDLLREVAARMQACLRGSDTVARLGGDQFVALVPTVATPEAGARVAHKVLAALDRPVILDGHEVRLSASVGLARFPDDGRDSRTLVMNADLALGRAKERGGRSVEVYTPSMNKPALERMRLERQLHQAIDRRELEAFFQPQIDLSTGQIGAFEVLARWRHPDRGYVSPAEFIPVAEESGLIVPLGEHMLEAACRQGRLWHERGWRVRLAVNLSVVQLRQKDLADRFAAVFSRTGFDPAFIELEITEALALGHDEASRSSLARLRELGVQLAIDDFGTGYSSLAYLTRLPVDALKIDRSFVSELAPGSHTDAVVKAIIAIARSLQMRVVAEGVETERQRELLTALGVDAIQGFLISRPLAAADATRLMSVPATAEQPPAPRVPTTTLN
jgi:diguanylate cyclase (GGDEF)-like protein